MFSKRTLLLLTVLLYLVFVSDLPSPLHLQDAWASRASSDHAVDVATRFSSSETFVVRLLNLTLPYRVIMQPDPSLCQKRPPNVLVMVLSMANNSDVRQAIRRTWANPAFSNAVKNGVVRVNFIVSWPKTEELIKQLSQEQVKFGDVVATDLPDSYDRLLYKVYALMQFSATSCHDAKYVMKVDEDVVLDVDRMLHFMGRPGSVETSAISCHIWSKAMPQRKPGSKWRMSYAEWPKKYYPTYCNGPAYLIGRDVVPKLLDGAKAFKPFKLEDILYTGIIAEKANVKRISWTKHLLHSNLELWKGWSICAGGVAETFGVHSIKGAAEIERGFKQLQNLKCGSPPKPKKKGKNIRRRSAPRVPKA